ncbi:hypothetical protein M0D21_13270 [Aquimarina sp. D1M17]|uniref:hypothetical protein n=1 Tax=Aquimarina acroporae TaxID=2937283 RepID=UPI0020C11AB2|nr:hypothetical protein [Aquimarina acroporae]MCK8522548.1 hypothetical protein [Aquimarina acroporae]
MLKGKKALYVLLPLVLGIWGAIIYQVTDAFSDDDPVLVNTSAVTFSKIEGKEREVFTISAAERDPFLGTMYIPKKELVQPKVTRPKPPEINWPTIRYKGLVTGGQGATAIYLIEINGVDQLMKRNDEVSEVRLTKGTNSWVQLRYKGKTKRFDILN